MQTQDKQAIKAKSFAIRSIMKEKNLSKILVDAFSAPLGSTKSAKAKAILKSLNQANSNFNYIADGQGGPFGGVSSYYNDQSSIYNPQQDTSQMSTAYPQAPQMSTAYPQAPAVPQPPIAESQSLSQAPGFNMPSNFAKSIDDLIPTLSQAPGFKAPLQQRILPSGQLEQMGSQPLSQAPGFNMPSSSMSSAGQPSVSAAQALYEGLSQAAGDTRGFLENFMFEEPNFPISAPAIGSIAPRIGQWIGKAAWDAGTFLPKLADWFAGTPFHKLLRGTERVGEVAKQFIADKDYPSPKFPSYMYSEKELAGGKEKLKQQEGAYKEQQRQVITERLGYDPDKEKPDPKTLLTPKEKKAFEEDFKKMSTKYGLNVNPYNDNYDWVGLWKTGGLEPLHGKDFPAEFAKKGHYLYDEKLKAEKETVQLPEWVDINKVDPETGVHTDLQEFSNQYPKDFDKWADQQGWTREEALAGGPSVSKKVQDPTNFTEVAGLNTGEYIDQVLSNPSVADYMNPYTSLLAKVDSFGSLEAAAENKAISKGEFRYILQSNPKWIAERLGLPESVAEGFSNNPLLSQQFNDLERELKKGFDLEAKAQKIKDLESQGLTIQKDLESYVRGKDQYLGDIDKLLDEAQTRIAYMDTSNPYVAKRMENYINYLTILKGRQNQRYTDMISSSIDYHDAAVKRAQSDYDSTYAKFNNVFEQEKAVEKETYDMLNDTIDGMYDNIANRTQLSRESDEHEWKRWAAEGTKAMNILRGQEIVNDINNPDITKVTNWDPYKEILGNMEGPSYDQTFVFSNHSPWDFKLVAGRAGLNSDSAFDYFSIMMGDNIKKNSETGTFVDELGEFKDERDMSLSRINKLIEDSQKKEGEGLSEADEIELRKYYNEYETITNKLNNGVREGVKTFLSDKIDDLRDSIKYLSSTKKYNKGKDNFIQRYDELEDVANALYDVYSINIAESVDEEVPLTPENISAKYNNYDNNNLANQVSIDIAKILTY